MKEGRTWKKEREREELKEEADSGGDCRQQHSANDSRRRRRHDVVVEQSLALSLEERRETRGEMPISLSLYSPDPAALAAVSILSIRPSISRSFFLSSSLD